MPEDARLLVSDKDALLNAVQSTHELRTARIDTLEDTLINNEVNNASDLIQKHMLWAYSRNRDRVVEIVAYQERNAGELNTLLEGGNDDE